MTRTENLNFIRAQLTIASWYLNRAGRADGDTSSHYLYHARQAYDIVMQLLPNVTLDEQSQDIHRELGELRERLRAAESASRVDGIATSWRPSLRDSSP
jgi:hypothetical protein